jgi:trk system potassium uptake protein TrkH
MSQRILSNLGFLLQIAGMLTVVPIGTGLYFNEIQQLIPLFVTCIAFLGCGFLLNALCERKDLDFKSSSILLLSAFIILPLIGAIPYVYTDPFGSANVLDRFTNSYFESVSGFTTTGFSFIANTDALPRSMLVFRSLTELMGGVGIVFLLLAFFQSKKSIKKLGTTLGIDNLNGSLRKMFLIVFAIYGIYIAVFTAIFYFLGYNNLLTTSTFVIDTITGGFQPSGQQFQQYLFLTPKILIIILMLVGSVNFAFNYHLFTGKIKKILSKEVVLFFAIIAIASLAVFYFANIEFVDSLFHVVSMSSATGLDYVGVATLNNTAVSIFIMLIVIGGCAFSMAGGIKISRLLVFGQSIGRAVKMTFIKEESSEDEYREITKNFYEYFPVIITILLFIVVLIVFAMLFTTMGVSFTDSIFEVGSALSTNGVSMGATTVAMPIGYKWLMIAAMTIGRVEILTILIALIPISIKKLESKEQPATLSKP